MEIYFFKFQNDNACEGKLAGKYVRKTSSRYVLKLLNVAILNVKKQLSKLCSGTSVFFYFQLFSKFCCLSSSLSSLFTLSMNDGPTIYIGPPKPKTRILSFWISWPSMNLTWPSINLNWHEVTKSKKCIGSIQHTIYAFPSLCFHLKRMLVRQRQRSK